MTFIALAGYSYDDMYWQQVYHICENNTVNHVNQRYLNPLTAGALYSGFHFLLAHWVPLFKYVKYKMWKEIWKELTSILSNLNNFHSLEVVDRVSETQLRVGENLSWIIWRLKG